MLALTDTAIQAIRDLMVGEDLPPEAGLRIAIKPDDQNSLELSLASTPQSGDEVIERGDARVFLEPAAASILQDRTLDAELSTSGHPSFHLTRSKP